MCTFRKFLSWLSTVFENETNKKYLQAYIVSNIWSMHNYSSRCVVLLNYLQKCTRYCYKTHILLYQRASHTISTTYFSSRVRSISQFKVNNARPSLSGCAWNEPTSIPWGPLHLFAEGKRNAIFQFDLCRLIKYKCHL